MPFSIRRPSHLSVLLLFIMTFFMLYGLPLFMTTDKVEKIVLSEPLIVFNSVFTTSIFLIPVLLWLYLVDGMRKHEMLSYLRLHTKGAVKAIAIGFLCFIFILLLNLALTSILKYMQVDIKNPVAEKIAMSLSPASIVFVSILQSTGEEIFFRGFLLRKFQEKLSWLAAIAITSLLFGLAHLSYGTWYQVLMPTIIGLLLGYTVIKTESLYSSITAHVTLNMTMLFIAYFLKSLIL